MNITEIIGLPGFYLRLEPNVVVQELYKQGFRQSGKCSLFYHNMLNQYLSIRINITIYRDVPLQCKLAAEIIDEFLLQRYNHAWSDINVERCRKDLNALITKLKGFELIKN